MIKATNLKISESLDELKDLHKLQKQSRNRTRVRAMILIKEGKVLDRSTLINYLDISIRTLERWIAAYIKGGMSSLLLPTTRASKSYLIPDEVDLALEHRVKNSEQGFSSYVEAKQWIASEFGIDLKYNTVREHLIRRYKTKIKSPRKSHVKKDPKAVAAFLKTA